MKRIVAVIAVLLLAGCASVDQEASWTQEKYYQEAKEQLDKGNYTTAIKYYETLQARYPYGVYADQAMLDSAYARYRAKENAQAVAEANRFIQQHPTHPHVDYAYYLKGLSLEVSLDGLFDFIVKQDVTERDPNAARAAFNAYKDLVTRFPNSRYTPDGRRRMEKLSQALATHELHAANYYLQRGAPLAAANRAKYIVENFPFTPQREDALGIMVSAYDALGEARLRDDAKRVLQLNYPDSVHLDGYNRSNDRWWAFWEKD